MNRDQGLRRTTTITGALIAASLAGTLGIAVAARANSDNTASSSTGSTGESSTSATDNSSSSNADSPSLTTERADSGQATSGGS